ncbi:MAG TPA: hypothetical protein VMH81_17865 [Bryobacteraceae bacterium]|nr:hypothetical protein [Bryobacteraceae bacterium]
MPTYIDRYLAGERIEVWNELVALGEAVRRKPVQADAIAVAKETMRRARHNIEALITRLSSMGYRFAAPSIERQLEKVNRQITEPKINPYVLRQLEKAVAGGKLPASMLNPRERPGFQNGWQNYRVKRRRSKRNWSEWRRCLRSRIPGYFICRNSRPRRISGTMYPWPARTRC